MQTTELHLHTSYSLLDGLNDADEYMARAAELGMTHLAITDHGNLSGHREFQQAAKAQGIIPILGCEMYISTTSRTDRRSQTKRDDDSKVFNHLTVLSQNEEGLKNLNRLSEIAWTEGFYHKPRIDMEVLEEYSEGLIVLSGCLGGILSKAVENSDEQTGRYFTSEFKRIFDDRFFVEIQGHNPKHINYGLLELANRYNVKPVVTSDCHYARKEDLWLEEAMLILSSKPKAAKNIDFSKSQKMDILDRFNYLWPERTMSFQEIEIYLRSATEHAEMLNAQGIGLEPIENTNLVASMIGDYPYHEGLDLLPQPVEGDAGEVLRDMVIAGAKKRGTYGVPEYDARREEELGIINSLDFDPYFIAVEQGVSWGKEQGIRFGPGRGSGAGSLVNYELGITEVDPIPNNLLFFRFINPERNDRPDIDIDVEDKRRSEVKDFYLRKYKHVASIATFGRFQGKNSVRDAARVFAVPLSDVNDALRGADWPIEMPFFELWEATDKGREFKKKYPEVIKLAKYLYKRLRTQGMHAGGLVISKVPINEYAPIQTAKDNSDEAGARIPLVALDMVAAEEIGFVKQDYLGLKALSVLSDTLDMIKERHGIDIDLNQLPLDDKKVYKTLSEGYTKGVFQCEQVPYTNLLVKMGVANFNELVASNALVRPGASKSTAGEAFIARKSGEQMITYYHPDMVEFTKDTYGVVIYQEQVMLTMTELAGMKMSTADKVRKIIGKKKDVSEFEQYKEEFITGAMKKVSENVARTLWHDFEAHAGYSFNKSHAYAYSLLSYWTAWLKEHYTIEYMTATLKNENDKDSRLDYLMETKRLGIKMLLPHVNESDIGFTIQNIDGEDYIRFGIGDIKFISGKIGNRLLEKRPFANYAELVELSQTKGSGISSRVLGSLNAIGAAVFDDNPKTGNERDKFYEYLSIPAFNSSDISPRMKAQFTPLMYYTGEDSFVVMGMVRDIKTGPGWARIEIVDESGAAGIFANEHTAIEAGKMYVILVANNRVARYASTDELANDEGGTFQYFLEAMEFPDVPEGMLKVVSYQSRVTKAGNKMADVVFSDGNKELVSAMVFPQMFQKTYSKLREGNVVDVKLAKTQDGKAMFVENVL